MGAGHKEELRLVPNASQDFSSIFARSMCHSNVAEIVEQTGGTAVFGWVVNPYLSIANDEFDGVINSMFHCNLLTPQGELVNVTPLKGAYHIFLPDHSRKWDFKTNTGYNNRTIYLDHYNPPKTAFNPSRNCTYFTAGHYASRDRLFEKFTIATNTQELFDAIPMSMKSVVGGEQMISPEGMKWISLRYNVAA